MVVDVLVVTGGDVEHGCGVLGLEAVLRVPVAAGLEVRAGGVTVLLDEGEVLVDFGLGGVVEVGTVGGVELPCGAVEGLDLGLNLTVGAVEGDVTHVGRCVPLEGGFGVWERALGWDCDGGGGGQAGEEESGEEHDCGCFGWWCLRWMVKRMMEVCSGVRHL